MARRKKREMDSGGGEWLTTYADMMTLLLCFFVLLYSMSQVDAEKFKSVAISLSKAFGGGNPGVFDSSTVGPTPITGSPGANSINKPIDQNPLEKNPNKEIYDEVIKFINGNDLEGKISIKEDRRGVSIELQENILFDSGKAIIKPESKPVLNKIGQLLLRFKNEVIVEGHTDNRPMNSGYYQSNWELSTDRAVKVVRYLAEREGLKGERFTAVGCGEYRPIATNNTADGRQKNRRVNILIVAIDKESSDDEKK